MDFEHVFLNALQSDIIFTKSKSIRDYLPIPVITPSSIEENLPIVQAFADITSNYPYYYELSHFNSYCLLYTVSGTGSLIFDNRSYALSPKSVALIDCRESHRIEIKQSPWNYKVFFMKGNPLPYLHRTFTDNYGNFHPLPPASGIGSMIAKFYAHLSKHSDNFLLQTKFIMDILLELIMEKNRLLETDSPIPDYLVEIKREFDGNYQNDFSLDALEAQTHISKYRICREFDTYFGASPIQYLNHRRIDAAKEALLYTDKRINEIGRMIGIENTNHFIRLFKQQTGVTPLVFRKHPPALSSFNP